jgi:uncharacterized membrane protein YbhN (UPF0104 family)
VIPAVHRSRLIFRTTVAVGITAGLVLFLFRYVDPSQVAQLFSRTRWPLWLAGLGVWVILYLGRAARFVLLASRTPYPTMLCVAAVHNFLLRVLPFRTGELAYAFLLKRAGTAGLGESLLGLLLIRILDFVAVVILFAIALAFHQGTYLGDRHTGLLAAAVAGLVGCGLAAALVPLLRLGLRVLSVALRAAGLAQSPRGQRLLEQVTGAVDGFARVRRTTILLATALSLGLWLLTFGAFFAILWSFAVPVGVSQTVLGSTAGVVTAFLPIGGVGSFGTLEAGWALGFTLVGLDRATAIASGFGVSLSTFAYGALLGLLGWIGLWAAGRRNRRSS